MRSDQYKNYLLLVLTVIGAFNGADRVVLAVVLQDIKIDLGLSDTQLGFLSGIAFALFYSVMGVPIARWADRGNRVLIISTTTALWCVAVVLCALTGSFFQLLLVRVVVAVGEAGCTPPALSLLASYFSRDRRAWATSMYSLGAPIAALTGFWIGGWLNDVYGWRVTFALLGIPGVLLAALAWLTLKDTRCATGSSVVQVPAVLPNWKTVLATLWPQRTFRHLVVCWVLNFLFGTGIVKWLPSFLARSHGLSSTQIGTGLALALGVGGIVGAYMGSVLASRLATYDESRQLRAVALAISAAGLMSILAYVSSSASWTFVLIAMFMLGVQTSSGPILGTIQTLVPEQMRAVSFALLYLVANLIGMGLGPVLAGVLSDAFVPWAGTESLRYALLLLSPGFFLSAWHLWRASRAVRGDLANAHARDARQTEIASAGAKRERFAGTSRASETSAF